MVVLLILSPIEVWVFVSRRLGYDGLEWHPMRPNYPSMFLLRIGLITQYGRNGVISVHQSYRGERSWSDVKNAVQRALRADFVSLVSYLLLAYKGNVSSHQSCIELMGYDSVFVFYPDTELLGKLILPGYIIVAYQITPSTKKLPGRSRIVYDLAHSEEIGWKRVSPTVVEIHIRSGEDLSRLGEENPISEIRRFINEDSEFNPLLKFLTMIRKTFKGNVCVEADGLNPSEMRKLAQKLREVLLTKKQ